MAFPEYRFGNYRLLTADRRLLAGDRPVKLGGRAFDLLSTLVEARDRAVSKRELMERVWPRLVVEDNNLQVQIVALRKILGPAAIATIPGRGYRFTPPTETVDGPPAGASDAAAQDTAHAPRVRTGNLAHDPPLLYGRADDVAAVRALLEQHRLVSIVGAAGIGKTRLAQAVAYALRDAYADGAWIVELAALNDRSLVVAEVGRVLGMQLGDAHGAIDQIVQALADRRLLLVLDNCEHLLDDVGELVAALRARAASVRVMITSQELLRQPDEHVYRLGGLGVPAEMTVSSALDAGAVELFVARAQAIEPRFVLRDDNVASVVEICRRLDGIPLAIELAAARVPLLGVDGVRARLDERFQILTAGSRLALHRHQTLRAAVEWSYGLLSQPEQRVFDNLGVFAGSFSLECAQKLAADEATDEWGVLDHLGALVDKSLVNVEPGPAPRYRMLETTRAFALERLAHRGTTARAMQRHAEVVLELFERVHGALMRGTPSARLVDGVSPDLDNLRSAMHWTREGGGDRGIAIALFGAAIVAHGYFHLVPLRSEICRWAAALEPLVDESIPTPVAARFWLACAECYDLQTPMLAIDYAERAIALYRHLGDRLYMFRGFEVLAYALCQTGRLEEARRALDQSFDLRDPSWPPWLIAINDNIASIVLGRIGMLSEARAHALACLAMCRQMSKPVDEWNCLAIVMDLDVAAGHLQRAAATASEMLGHPMARDHHESGRNLRLLATALTQLGRFDEAEPVYRQALSRVRRNYDNAAIVLYDASLLVARRGRIDDAARVLAYAEAVAAREGWQPRPVALKVRGELLALLAADRSADDLVRLRDEGRKLTDDEACALAFPR
jgi:predicted ATPase/DNA-binding winged helix-turn-helix (wHTH) protein